MNKTVLIIMLIWGVGLLSLAQVTLKTFKDSANEKLLFKVVADRSERDSIIVTTTARTCPQIKK